MISNILLDSGQVPLDQVQKFLGLLQLSTNVSEVVATLFVLTPKGQPATAIEGLSVSIRKGFFRSFDEDGPFPVRNEEASPENAKITAPIGDPGVLNAAGFGQATTYSIWSRELGYLAGEGDIVQFIAVKGRRTDADKAVISGVAHPSDLDGSIARG